MGVVFDEILSRLRSDKDVQELKSSIENLLTHKEDATVVVKFPDGEFQEELTDNHIFNCERLYLLEIIPIENPQPIYICQLNFSSAPFDENTGMSTEIVRAERVIWSGDDINARGYFEPVENKRYVIIFYSDGVDVRGVVQAVNINVGLNDNS